MAKKVEKKEPVRPKKNDTKNPFPRIQFQAPDSTISPFKKVQKIRETLKAPSLPRTPKKEIESHRKSLINQIVESVIHDKQKKSHQSPVGLTKALEIENAALKKEIAELKAKLVQYKQVIYTAHTQIETLTQERDEARKTSLSKTNTSKTSSTRKRRSPFAGPDNK